MYFYIYNTMKVLPFKIPKTERNAVIFQEDKVRHFYNKLHQHEETQISLIVEGEGALIVGDTVNHYKKGDILVIGSNVPHVFMGDKNENSRYHMLSLFFSKRSFGEDFFELVELKEIASFFKRAQYGFKLNSSKQKASTLIYNAKDASRLERLVILLQLLKIGSEVRYTYLSSFISSKQYSDNEGNRLRDIFEFTMNNFTTPISLQTVADVANMTKNAFCKYFKKRTNKTYIQFLNEMRIGYATRLLSSDEELPIIEVAERCGFNNLSNFNRQFKHIKGFTPSKSRRLGRT